jgi:hypothetical protein
MHQGNFIQIYRGNRVSRDFIVSLEYAWLDLDGREAKECELTGVLLSATLFESDTFTLSDSRAAGTSSH